jgi:hypothetical protein
MTLYLATDNQPNTFRKERITQATAAGVLQMVGGAAAALGRGHPGFRPPSHPGDGEARAAFAKRRHP